MSIRQSHGFTMIEIVVVLAVLIIVSAIVISRYTTTGTNELMAETDALKASLRFAAIQSLNNDTLTTGWGIYFPNDTSYALYKNGAAATVAVPAKYPDPAKDPPPNNMHKLQGNVRMMSGVGSIVAFDKWGRPIDESGNPLTADISLTLVQGTQASTITVTKNTGFIP
ncbi:MAG TPA: prepilin-type N-terminal cleavage/methylation domain-containing protein [Syntrophales bacterium]|nr:prepilin-type N-terminal cleavage/methylation domain-containing protein [Syntrophales bacterium]